MRYILFFWSLMAIAYFLAAKAKKILRWDEIIREAAGGGGHGAGVHHGDTHGLRPTGHRLRAGSGGNPFREFRQAGFGILLFPAVIVAATAVLAVGMGALFPQLSVKESLAISFGYGWYTFEPGVITSSGHSVAG